MMTKKKKGIIIAIVSILVIAAVGCGLYFGLNKGDADAPVAQVEDGEIYRTKTESFWVGVGKAYISFQHKEEPANKPADDTELYGDVFYIMVSSGEGFDPWLSGYWNLDEAGGKLMMKAEWDETAENQTKLADAKSGEEKIYLAENGEYKIPVELPSANVTFTLNPATDKVGSITPAPEDETKSENKNEEKTDENTGNIFARLTAQDSLFNGDVKGYAQIDMLKDNTWTMKVKVEPYVPDYTQAVNGKWTENGDGSVTLNITGGDYKDALNNTITFQKASDGTYSGTVKFTADKANGIIFTFNFKSTDISKDTTASTQNNSTKKQNTNVKAPSTVSGEYRVNMNEKGIYSNVVGTSYISFTPDSKFKVMVQAQGTSYDPWIQGTWKVNGNKLTLTSEENNDTGIDGIKNGSITYTADNGKVTVKAHFQGGGTASYTVDIEVLKGNSTAPQPSNPTPTPTPKPDDKPNGGSTQEPEQGDIKLTGQTETSGVTCLGDMLIKTDKTWKLQLNVYNMGYQDALWGTWSKNKDGSLELIVSGQNNQLTNISKNIKVAYNSNSKEYSATVKFTSAGFDFVLPLNGKDTGSASTPEPTVQVTGISLDKQSLELTVGKTASLTATVSPNNATNKGVTWTSAEESVATVDSGKITAKSAGTTYIIAATKDGGFVATCKVTVSEPSADSEYYVASSNDKCNGFPMSLIFENGSFHLNVDTTYFDASDWFKGTYTFNNDKTELTLNASYNTNGPHFEAAEANAGNSIILKADNGKFIIVVKDPTASSVNGTFTLAVGSSSEEPENPNVPDPPAAELQLELAATDTIDVYGTSYTANAKLELYDDNTFKMLVDASQGFVEAASGTWELDAAYNMVLTVKEQTVANSLPETITLNVNYATYAYSGKVTYAASAYTTFNFEFAQKTNEPEKPAPKLQLELAATDTIDVYGTPYTANAKLELYDNNTFKMLVDAGQGFVEAASGAWELDAAYNMVLTVKEQTVANSLPETITLNVDYTTYEYSGKVTYVASAYTTFNFEFAPKTNKPEKPALKNDITLNASDSIYGGAVTCDSVMNVKTDGTWTMNVTVYGNTIDNAASGTWVKKDDDTLVLTVTQKADGAGLADTITLAYDPTTDKYNTSVALNCMGQFDFTLNFA